MTNDALINNKVQYLTDEERKSAEKFHMSRYPFAWIKGSVVFNDTPNDDRDHQHWMLEDYGISVQEFEDIARGYMIPERIQLFKGSKFEPIKTPIEYIQDDINLILEKYYERYQKNVVPIYNGVYVGKIGDIWEPMHLVGIYERKIIWGVKYDYNIN